MKSFVTVLICFSFVACSHLRNQAKKESKLSLDSLKNFLQGTWKSTEYPVVFKIFGDSIHELNDTPSHGTYLVKYADSNIKALYILSESIKSLCRDINGNIIPSAYGSDLEIDSISQNTFRAEGILYNRQD